MASLYEVISWYEVIFWTKGKLHEPEHHSRMRASLDGSRCLDGARVSSQLPKLPNKESRDRRRAERKYFVEHRRELGLLDR
jgi:hypothetical protein